MTHIFIINPFAGNKTFADDLRTKLEKVKNLDYFVFNTRYAGYETELVRKIQHIFEGEELRFYCCGGSGTMRNMLNGFDNLSDVEVAFFPCGLTNDFLKVFGSDEQRFYHIEELIDGDVIEVDYIKSNTGIALNTLSTGLDSNTVIKMDDYRDWSFIGRNVPYTMAVLHAIFVSNPHEYEITLDGEAVDGKYAEVFFGNGCTLGGNLHFTDKACATDGKGMSALIDNRRGFSILPILFALQKKNCSKLKQSMESGLYKKICIRRKSGSTFSINQDGELITNTAYCEAEIVHKGLKLVVPRGVTL